VEGQENRKGEYEEKEGMFPEALFSI